ncbi:hypothetical protein ACFXI8_23760 [Streptomyces niveus]|uniref:hypothetical protein n=1 Tax=Streptomyces niveus TaxID=193462 RepID=UPI0036CEFCAC
MLTATIAVPADSAEPPNFDRGRQVLEEIQDPSLFNFDEPKDELGKLLPDLGNEVDLVGEDGEPLLDYARLAGLAILDDLEEALDSRETTFLTVAGYKIYLSGGLSHGDSPTETADAISNAYKLPASVLCGVGFVPDYEKPLSRANGSGGHVLTDTDVVDAIALGLGTSPEWPGTATLEWIADAIGKVRSHPGGGDPRKYQAEFTVEHAVDPLDDGFLAMYVGEGADKIDTEESCRGRSPAERNPQMHELAVPDELFEADFVADDEHSLVDRYDWIALDGQLIHAPVVGRTWTYPKCGKSGSFFSAFDSLFSPCSTQRAQGLFDTLVQLQADVVREFPGSPLRAD